MKYTIKTIPQAKGNMVSESRLERSGAIVNLEYVPKIKKYGLYMEIGLFDGGVKPYRVIYFPD